MRGVGRGTKIPRRTFRVQGRGNTSKRLDPLHRVISRAAGRSGIDSARVAWVATFLFDEIAQEVCAGSIVYVPGFGAFGVRMPIGGRTRGVPIPAMEPLAHFRAQLRSQYDPDSTAGTAAEMWRVRRVAQKNAGAPQMLHRSTTSAMARMRESIRRTAGKQGMTIEDPSEHDRKSGLIVEDSTVVGGRDRATGADVVRPKTAGGKADESTDPTDAREAAGSESPDES